MSAPTLNLDVPVAATTRNVCVLGLDLSLTSTGMAEVTSDGYKVRALKPPKGRDRGHERLAWILDTIWNTAFEYEGGHLVVVEGPSYGAKGSSVHQIAGLWWLVVHKLWTSNVQVAIAPPAAVKKYATGKGNAGKDDMMLATARRFPDFDGGNDAADALWLAAMGCDQLGEPLVAMPAAHRVALGSVEWPAGVGADV